MNARVETRSGQLQGKRLAGHLAFLGVPYAAPPVGPLRFARPAPPEPWSGVREATNFSASAPQGTPFAPGLDANGPQSEDCLYLNVFTRALGPRKRPVLFWIHGGAYTVGTAGVPLYDGGPLAELGDVVVVTHNYRLGAFGFLHLGEAGERADAVANAGILDHIAALTWVRENIAELGGDPDNVTLFGESAGATSVCSLLIAPAARPLFCRAIAQSPALYPRLPAREGAATVTRDLLAKLGLGVNDVARLRALPTETISSAQRALEQAGQSWRLFSPVRDAHSLPLDPIDAFADPSQPKKPLIVGSNRDEWNLFDAGNIARWSEPMARDALIAKLSATLKGLSAERAEQLASSYEHSRRALDLPHDNRALLRAIRGDLIFRMPCVRQAELHVGAAIPAYVYLFTYESPAMRGALRACHALDLPFVFGTYGTPVQERFAGSGEVVARLSETIMRTWISFAEHGVPTHLPDFAAYELSARPSYELSAHSKLTFDPLGEERAAWDGIV